VCITGEPDVTFYECIYETSIGVPFFDDKGDYCVYKNVDE
jgi:hypothetical protein